MMDGYPHLYSTLTQHTVIFSCFSCATFHFIVIIVLYVKVKMKTKCGETECRVGLV